MSNIFNDEYRVFVNSTGKYACVATEIGFTIYGVHPLKKIISREIQGGVSIIKMLDESNIFLFVGRSENGPYPYNKFIIWDDNKKVILGEILYNQRIQNVDVTNNNIYIQTDKKLYIYQFDNLLLLKQLDCNNLTNFCLSYKDNQILVYPSLNVGEICIINMKNEQSSTIQAHNSNIENVVISNNGKYIATASEKGTIIRLFDVETKKLLNEFRRGTEYVNIIQLAFHPNLSLLLVESDKGTIHIFNTELDIDTNEYKPIKIDNMSNEIWQIPNNRIFENYGISYIKFLLPNYFHSKWSFMSYTISNVNTLNIFDENTCMIYSFGNDGQYYECAFNDINNPSINKVMKYIIDKDDPFKDRKNN
jgi:WD40 repeat protein